MMLANVVWVQAQEVIQDLGKYGSFFEITETDFIHVMLDKLHSLEETGKLADHQRQIQERLKRQVNRPEAVVGVYPTGEPRSFAHDPSVLPTHNLTDHDGRVFHRQGEKINPLDHQSLRSPLLFINGDDSAQVAWAVKQVKEAPSQNKPKIVLIQGAPLELTRRWGWPFYFDQGGRLIKKLGISQVPARVSQQGLQLWVEEVTPDEKRPREGEPREEQNVTIH